MIQPDFLFANANLPPPPQVNWTSSCVEENITQTFKSNITDSYTAILLHSGLTDTMLGYVLIICSSLGMCALFFGTKKLLTDVHPLTYCFWNALIGTSFSLIIMSSFEQITMPSSWWCITMLLVHAVGTTQVSILGTWCLQYMSSSVYGMVNGLQQVILILFQYTILRNINPGLHNWVEVLGGVLCFIGVVGGPTYSIIKDRMEAKVHKEKE